MRRKSWTPENGGAKHIFRALSHRNYRLFFGGQGVSLVGTWMQQIAMSWLVYRLTGSALLLGVVGFASQIPTFLLTTIAGVLVDRWEKRRILVVTQTFAMLQAFALAVLTLTESVVVWQIVALSAFLGCVNAFDAPARQSFVVEIVQKRENLGNAIALNSFLFNGARLVGPSIAGIVIAFVGEGICFLLNGISFAAVIVALLAMRLPLSDRKEVHSDLVQGLKEGFRYSFGSVPIRMLLASLAVVSLFGMPYAVLMPVFAKSILHGDSHTLGFLMGATGVGALVGAMYLASRKSVLGLGKLIPTATTVFGIGLMAFSQSTYVPLSLLLMLIVGLGMMVQMASTNTLLQTIVDDDKRGRVMSLYTMAFIGTAPFGSLISGSLAERIGAPSTLLIGGVICVVVAALFSRKLPVLQASVRPVYEKKGIIAPLASGVESASELAVPPAD
ncbi:MAG: MFS transporter [Ignavibacteriales bacterium CG07_land_8_20_14_0_80_59_12]|nr:MAG: MFS transporter [Ignavibacteriales bacterium CG07_land_8_20_14_0_80_59_12]